MLPVALKYSTSKQPVSFISDTLEPADWPNCPLADTLTLSVDSEREEMIDDTFIIVAGMNTII